ncbi:GNAT family N-acetyltransferase [Marivirga harenae]|uniref:GNAT family N-acetyltransferase n=1 Tax=Marivirga harenae TaxID=2010992 RepID=UPI0026DEDC13|nr:GNAT family N-acetyltransferase [Marivirga harenae]WKV13135.1 GNAT family N-acetyltransferase [Marivirga harenae]|tara:strand:- start:281261 stop:281755 length:495 start_codon:yes stop_codon:yes gene_type:complete
MRVDFFRHNKVSEAQLQKIVELKNTVWPYGIDSQKDWINTHMNNTDYHVVLEDNGTFLAYACLININVFSSEESSAPFLGIAGVCSKTQGQGHGQKIMKEIVNFLRKNELKGLLFCKKELAPFYSKAGFLISKINFESNKPDIFAMSVNHEESNNLQFYNGNLF